LLLLITNDFQFYENFIEIQVICIKYKSKKIKDKLN
jgi:hypothetical protein